jgi:hypothetical protein
MKGTAKTRLRSDRAGPLRGTLKTLLRTTIHQVGAVSDVARRSARSQKQRLDGALLERRRREVLAELGDSLYQLVQDQEIELDELPELARWVDEVEELDRRIAEAEAGERPRRPAVLTRSARAGRGADGREQEEVRVWRPPTEDPPAGLEDPPAGSAAPTDRAPPGPAEVEESAGGIVFLGDDIAAAGGSEEDDLAPYMNDDDVPGAATRKRS